VNRYTKSFADDMLKEIQNAGLDQLWFGWAGDTEQGIGHPHYYRIHGPTIIIEYDNTQNNGNHIHTVVRDLKNDFGVTCSSSITGQHMENSDSRFLVSSFAFRVSRFVFRVSRFGRRRGTPNAEQ
jgi:hypothetical protein